MSPEDFGGEDVIDPFGLSGDGYIAGGAADVGGDESRDPYGLWDTGKAQTPLWERIAYGGAGAAALPLSMFIGGTALAEKMGFARGRPGGYGSGPGEALNGSMADTGGMFGGMSWAGGRAATPPAAYVLNGKVVDAGGNRVHDSTLELHGKPIAGVKYGTWGENGPEVAPSSKPSDFVRLPGIAGAELAGTPASRWQAQLDAAASRPLDVSQFGFHAPSLPDLGTVSLDAASLPSYTAIGDFMTERGKQFSSAAQMLQSQADQYSLGPLTEARMAGFKLASETLGIQREQTLGNINAQFSRNRISGSSLAESVLSSARAEFAQRDAQLQVQAGEARAQSILQELDTKTKLLTQASALRVQAAQANLDSAFKIFDTNADLAKTAAGLNVDLVKVKAGLLGTFTKMEQENLNMMLEIAQREAAGIRAGKTAIDVARIGGKVTSDAARLAADTASSTGWGKLFEPFTSTILGGLGKAVLSNF